MDSVPPPTSTVHHGHRRAYSGEPPSQPSTPIDTGRRGEAIGGDLTADDLTGDLASEELWSISVVLCFYVSEVWVPIDRGPRLSVYVMIHFLIYFSRFECKFQKFISQARSVQFW